MRIIIVIIECVLLAFNEKSQADKAPTAPPEASVHHRGIQRAEFSV